MGAGWVGGVWVGGVEVGGTCSLWIVFQAKPEGTILETTLWRVPPNKRCLSHSVFLFFSLPEFLDFVQLGKTI